MLLRARALHVLLALGILLSQQAALLHGFSHFEGLARQLAADRSSAASLRTDHPDVDPFCVECLAFAQVATAVPGQAIDIGLPTSPDSELRVRAQPRLGASLSVPFLARAPPTPA